MNLFIRFLTPYPIIFLAVSIYPCSSTEDQIITPQVITSPEDFFQLVEAAINPDDPTPGTIENRTFRSIDLAAAKISGTYRWRVQFSKCIFEDMDLTEATISDATFNGCIFRRTNFRNAAIRNVLFDGCTLENVDMEGIQTAEENTWNINFLNCLISESRFNHANMHMVCFWGSTLQRVQCADIKLNNGLFANSTIQQVNFDGAEITETCFGGSNLTDTVFTDSYLSKVRFCGCKLFTGTAFEGTIFAAPEPSKFDRIEINSENWQEFLEKL